MRQPAVILNLRKVCQVNGITLRVLAAETGRSKSFWQRVWANKADVGLRAFLRVCQATETPPCQMLETPDWPCRCAYHDRREEG